MKNILTSIALFCVTYSTFSANIVDVYGADKHHSLDILSKYLKQVSAIQSEFHKETVMESLNGKESSKIKLIRAKRELLAEKIKQDGDFLFVSFDTITYSHTGIKPLKTSVDLNGIYTTIEVVEKNQPERLRFITPKIDIKKKNAAKANLIDKMIQFNDILFNLEDNNQYHSDALCPVYHCLLGFDHSKLKSYLNVFNVGVIKEKKLILYTLNHDTDPERRSAAALLLGHLSDPNEIISILLPHVNDPSFEVRNDAMRVIEATMQKGRISIIDVRPFLDLLNSPYCTDRNKALYVLLAASKHPSSRSLIMQQGIDNLLSILRLKQPNNHNPAYLILKNISGKRYGEYDLKAWDRWGDENKSNFQKTAT